MSSLSLEEAGQISRLYWGEGLSRSWCCGLVSHKNIIIAQRLLHKLPVFSPRQGPILQSLSVGENFAAVYEFHITYEDPIVCLYSTVLNLCMRFSAGFLIKTFFQTSGLLCLLFAIYNCWGIFNVRSVHTGPSGLSPLSKKARHLIYNPRFLKSFHCT